MPGAFLDPAVPPEPAEIEAALGDARSLWQRIAVAIESAYGASPEPWFFGRSSGWVARYRRGKRALLLLLPEPGACSAIVVLGPSVLGAVAALTLDPAVRSAIDGATDYPEGRWMRVRVDSAAIADDVIRLVESKAPPPRRPATRAPRAIPAP